MKKTLGLFALTTAVVGFTFAADPVVKFSGYVDSGIKATKVDTADFVYTPFANDDDSANNAVAKVTGKVTADNYGATATVKAGDKTGAALADAAVWWSPVEGLVLNGGTGYANVSFKSNDDAATDKFFSEKGFAATYTIAGLSVGGRVSPLGTSKAGLGFGAAYDLPGVAAFRLNGDAVGADATNFYASGALTAITGLGLSAGFYNNTTANKANQKVDVAASYAITPDFSAGAAYYQFLDDSYFSVKPNVSYTVAPGVKISGYYKFLSDKQKDSAGKLGSDNEVQGKLALSAGPGTFAAWVQYNTAPKTLVVQGDFTLSF